MELKLFEHALKNIPVAGQKEYLVELLHNVKVFIHNTKWRVDVATNPEKYKNNSKKTFGFNSTRAPPHIKELEELQEKLAEMVKNIQFTNPARNKLQDKLRSEIKEINKDTKVYVKADKTANHYKVSVEEYEKLVEKSIHSDYRKADAAKVNEIEQEAKTIAHKLELGNRIFKTSKREAKVTLKDHKSSFSHNPTCRLLNPTKPELGKISKQILAKVITAVRSKTGLNQWKNTNSVLEWFRTQPNKKRLKFIQFDVESFYPSITPELLNKALDWATTFTPIAPDERDIIIHSKRSLLYFKGSPWVKQQNPDFDVGMGSFDGAECCDIVGLYLLSQLQAPGINIGLYRDDGLATSSLTNRQTQLALQKIDRIMQGNGLKIPGAEANRIEVDFLDVTLNLATESHKPYHKPGDNIKYVHVDSNHPPSTLKNIPLGVNRRLSDISSNQAIFEAAAPLYQEALDKAGYKHKLSYIPLRVNENTSQPRRRCRKRKITWFNPPYNKAVKTNVASTFLSIIDSCFPSGHPLRPILNRNTIKVSYRTMTNMARVISKHNTKVIARSKPVVVAEPGSNCNCKAPHLPCPLDNQCLTEGVIYNAKVTATLPAPRPTVANPSPPPTIKEERYTGLTINTAKKRITSHNGNINNREQKGTTLSAHIWELKDKGIPHEVTWSILATASGYNTTTKQCRLCLTECWYILFKEELATLNRRQEIFSSCRHKARLTLSPKEVVDET